MSPAPDQPPTPEPNLEPNPEPNPERPRGRPTPRGRPRANRVFTNRDRPIAAFDRAHTTLAADEHRILGFYGVGGQGKTALRRHLMQRLGTAGDPGHRFGVLDFHVESCREPARGLLALRRSLRDSGALRCDTFDVAIARFWARAYPGEDVTRALGDLLGGLLDGAPDWLDLVEDLPAGLGLGVKVINCIRQRLKEEGAEAACAALRDLEHLEPDQIAEQLPGFLGLDLQSHRARHPRSPAPVCFIDTYEALWSAAPDKTGLAALETDAWVRDLVAGAPGVVFVILGRERLTWDQRFPHHWASRLDDQHLLSGLAAADADRLLAGIPIPDLHVRRAIIRGAGSSDPSGPGDQGAHPFYLDLAIDTWLDLLAAGGRTPIPADFGATHPEVLARFLRHRTPAEQEALKVLAGPAAFDREVFAALLTRFRIPYPLTAFEDLCDLSIIEPGADGCFRLHGLMRSHLLAALPPGLRTELDAWLFDWFDARCQPAGPRDITPAHAAALREAVAHRDTADTQAALGWFWQRWRVFYDAARHTLLEPLVRWALALAESRLGADHPETAVALNNKA
ncbi:hypothetical protein [Lamprocystis purpurea]|jgi:hypothetical protein|uniref:hypothetical protein n=1 Tax=Lamprocystis purpurea TaxID=61598 RepID=UPI0003AA77A5|nr:hypothetical protein [Lamprocystis purpurea]